MRKPLLNYLLGSLVFTAGSALVAQPYNVQDFDSTAEGPWSEISKTVTGVAKVPNGSVSIDGELSAAEYGNIPGVTVTPGDPANGGNAWILDFPPERSTDGPDDTSFTFWLAHDDDFLYVGVKAKDDVVQSDDPNDNFWRDDAIEIVTDVFFDRLDNNVDSSNDEYGGHNYVNYLGRFSRWDDAADQRNDGIWATGVDWSYGENGDIFGKGGEVEGGWQMEVRMHKRMFDPDGGEKLRKGHRIGFNIGMDDDDGRGGPANEAPNDLEIQYFWANRGRTIALTELEKEFYTDLEIAYGGIQADSFLEHGIINAAGRLSHGGTGEIIFGFDPPAGGERPNILFFTSNAELPINSDPHLIALFEASGYNVTLYSPASGSAEDAQATRDAADGMDLVFLSETIGSGTVIFDDDGDGIPTFVLKDTDVPIISFEAFMYEDADWTGKEQHVDFGNSGRPEPPADLQDTGRTSFHIQDADHPIAGGMTGEVEVYDWPYSLSWGNPSADATVVASILADGTFPTTFVYEKGDALVDGSIAPNTRIGLFLGQAGASIVADSPFGNTPAAAGAPRWNYLSEAGRTQVINAVNYAVGAGGSGGGGGPAELSIARSGTDLVITYGGGGLESAPAITGPWTSTAGASPLTIQPSGSARFYRVR